MECADLILDGLGRLTSHATRRAPEADLSGDDIPPP